MPPIDAVLRLVNRHFSDGAQVEVSRNDLQNISAWYQATVLSVYKPPRETSYKALVQYVTFDDQRLQSREEVNIGQLRPAQPAEEKHKYAINDCVDMFKSGGWWEGVIVEICKKEKEYSVYCKHSRELDTYNVSELRPHREWVCGNWHPGLNEVPVRSRRIEASATNKQQVQQQDDSLTLSKETDSPAERQDGPSRGETSTKYTTPNRKQSKHDFKIGQPVEVRSDEEGFKRAWFPGTVVQTLNANKYQIKYDHFMTDDGESNLIENVDSENMRPCPPTGVEKGGFDYLEIVDAFHNDCWWAGAIIKILADDEYIVNFTTTNENIKFNYSQLRVHQDWINGEWVKVQFLD